MMGAQEVIELSKRRGIFWPSFEIYGGLSGFYDYGPIGSLIKDNIIAVWKNIFINIEGMAPIDSPNITISNVFEASGHTKVFSDYITYCKNCGEAYRVDELIKKKMPDFEFKSYEDMVKKMRDLDLKCEKCGGELTDPESFNLMFSTKVGPGNGKLSYLRPETAQGIFVNFLNYFRYFRESLPFGVVQVGKGFRNEIAPRQGLIRLREFNMAEAEVFFNPNNIQWPENIKNVMDLEVKLLPNTGGEVILKLRDALKNGIIKQQPIAYFIGLSYLFLKNIGMDGKRIRFRQHHKEELAHYSNDCWDCEINTSYGWIEVIGIADRNQYDLKMHSKYSGEDMEVKVQGEKRIVKKKVYEPKEEYFKNLFGEKWKIAMETMKKMEIEENPVVFGKEIPEEAYSIKEIEITVDYEKVLPWVIEPSFGIDRIFFSLLEHNLYKRKENNYNVLKLKPHIAPFKVAVFPLMVKDNLDSIAHDIYENLKNNGISCYYDDSGSIGKRYARADEIGVPYCITVDYQTLKDKTVTIRERDSTDQERIHIDDILQKIRGMIEECSRLI